MHSSILKIKTATNTWIFVTDIVNICLYNTQCNKYTFYHQIYSLLFRNVLQIRMKDMLVENMKPESFWGVHVVSYCEYLWEQSDILPFDLRGELEAALRRLLNCPTYSHKLGLKSWKTYFHILKSAFSYSIFWQTQFETSFWLSIFIGDIHFSEYTQGNLSFWIDNGGNLIGCLNFYQRQVAPPKRMNFQKNFKLPLTPRPHFRKVILHPF